MFKTFLVISTILSLFNGFKSRPQLRLRLTVFVVQLVFFFSYPIYCLSFIAHFTSFSSLQCLFHPHCIVWIACFISIQLLVSIPFNHLFHFHSITCFIPISFLVSAPFHCLIACFISIALQHSVISPLTLLFLFHIRAMGARNLASTGWGRMKGWATKEIT